MLRKRPPEGAVARMRLRKGKKSSKDGAYKLYSNRLSWEKKAE